MQAPAQPGVDRRSERLTYCALLAAAVLGSSVWFVSDVGANDLWWHLAAGREFFAHGHVPRLDTLSFTFADQPWANHEWLWGVAAFALYRSDPEWLALANFALLALALAGTFETSLRVAYAPAAAVVACWLAASCTSFFSDIRPHLVTLLGTALILATRDVRCAPWLWPGLLVLWCNLHAGYLFGLGAVGLLVLTRGVQLRLRGAHVSWTRRRWFAACASLVLCCLAIGCNPWGFQLLDYVLSYAPGAQRSLYANELNEWQPLGFGWSELRFFGPIAWWSTFRGRYACVLALAAVGIPRVWRRDPYVVWLALTTVLMALRAQRFVELSVLALAPLVATGIALLSGWLARPLLRLPSAVRP
ncbi:MAG: hypothetical protein RL701_15, partial [Pseudomonadota bacterium]